MKTVTAGGRARQQVAQRPKIGILKKTSFKRTRTISRSPNKPLARLGGARPAPGGRQSRFAPAQTVGIDPARLSGVKFSRSASASNRGNNSNFARGGGRSLSARRALNTSATNSGSMIRRVGAGAGLKKKPVVGRNNLKSRLGLNPAVVATNQQNLRR